MFACESNCDTVLQKNSSSGTAKTIYGVFLIYIVPQDIREPETFTSLKVLYAAY